MGNEIFYCIRCGSRVSGPDFGGDRSHCAACLGIPADPTPRPGRDSSKRIRKPSSGTATAVAVRARPPATAAPRSSRAALVGGLSLAGSVLFALGYVLAPPREVERPAMPAPMAVPEPVPASVPAPAIAAEEPPKAQRPPPVSIDPEVEALADEIEEAASALADEGRFDDALARIRAFPAEHRNTRSWTSLEGLRRQIEARARTK